MPKLILSHILLTLCGVNTARLLKYVWRFCNIMHERVKINLGFCHFALYGIYIRGGSRTAPISKMELFVIIVNYYYKLPHLGCCSSPRSASVYVITANCFIIFFFKEVVLAKILNYLTCYFTNFTKCHVEHVLSKILYHLHWHRRVQIHEFSIKFKK